jgi:hypothetical protein
MAFPRRTVRPYGDSTADLHPKGRAVTAVRASMRPDERTGGASTLKRQRLRNGQLPVRCSLTNEHTTVVRLHGYLRRALGLKDENVAIGMTNDVPLMQDHGVELRRDGLTTTPHQRIQVTSYPDDGPIVSHTARERPTSARVQHRADTLEPLLPLTVELSLEGLRFSMVVQCDEGLKIHHDQFLSSACRPGV